MENEVKTKVCKKCGQELPLDQFHIDDTEMTPEKWEKILRIMRMSEQLEDVSFLKGIE